MSGRRWLEAVKGSGQVAGRSCIDAFLIPRVGSYRNDSYSDGEGFTANRVLRPRSREMPANTGVSPGVRLKPAMMQ